MQFNLSHLNGGGKEQAKAQSAMEYLMTYGWSILIIAIVLAALFELGVFGGSSLGTSCVAQQGFSCQNPIYAHGTAAFGGNIIVTIGQTTGMNWASANVIFLNATNLATFQSTGSFPASPPANLVGGTGTLNSGTALQIDIPVSGNTAAATPIGTVITGQIWASYRVNGVTYYSRIGTLNAKAA